MSHPKDKYIVGITHRTPLKCIVNPILRRIQFWTDRPWVITSLMKEVDDRLTFVRYEFHRVLWYRRYPPKT